MAVDNVVRAVEMDKEALLLMYRRKLKVQVVTIMGDLNTALRNEIRGYIGPCVAVHPNPLQEQMRRAVLIAKMLRRQQPQLGR